jgi:hypothetical protein
MTATPRAENPTAALVVQRWRRFGKDRAYVSAGGAEAGYRDLATGAVHARSEEHADTIRQVTEGLYQRAETARAHAARGYHPRHARADEQNADGEPAAGGLAEAKPEALTALMEPSPEPDAEAVPDRDLATNEPAASTRSRAVELRRSAPLHTAVARLVGLHTDERAWRIGADAELAVARRLRGLGDEWHVLHSVPVGTHGGDIDHVVIGPGGVFTINTKHHPQARIWVGGDVLQVNGQFQPYVRNSRHEARRAARLLSERVGFAVAVHGIVAVKSRQFTVKQQPGDGAVTVVAAEAITDTLGALPDALPADDVQRIYSAARHLATWQPGTVEWSDF